MSIVQKNGETHDSLACCWPRAQNGRTFVFTVSLNVASTRNVTTPTTIKPPTTDISAIHHTLHRSVSTLKSTVSEFELIVVDDDTLLQSAFVFVTVTVGFSVCATVEFVALQTPPENVTAVNSYPDLLFVIISSV